MQPEVTIILLLLFLSVYSMIHLTSSTQHACCLCAVRRLILYFQLSAQDRLADRVSQEASLAPSPRQSACLKLTARFCRCNLSLLLPDKSCLSVNPGTTLAMSCIACSRLLTCLLPLLLQGMTLMTSCTATRRRCRDYG